MRWNNKTYIYIVLSIIAFVVVSQTFAVINENESADSGTAPYVQNEIIVKYKADYAPQVLRARIQDRDKKRTSIFGSLGLFIDNLKYQFTSEEKPESRLARIEEADEDIGATNKSRVFDADDVEQRSVYVIELDGTMEVEEAIKRYDQLPEVEYVEPNYIFQILN